MNVAVFLRAINVGTTNRVRMDTLREWCAEAGYPGAQTHLQTGNLVIDSTEPPDALAARIEEALAARGLKGAFAIVRTRAELEAIVADCPFDRFPAESFRQLATLFRDPFTAEASERLAAVPGVVLVRDRELLTVTEVGADRGTANTMAAVGRLLKGPSTARYWGVIRDVLGKME